LSLNKNAIPKKISANLFEGELANDLKNLKNVRFKNDKIKMDDLSSDIVNKINAWGAPAGSSYNDTELRNRIIALENNQIPKANVFNKTSNVVTKDLLDGALKGIVDLIPQLNSKIQNLESGKLDKSQIHAEKIQINHLADDVVDKINAAYAYYLSSLPSGDVGNISSTADILNAIKTLKNTKADKSEIAGFRRKSEKILVSDMEASAATVINRAANLQQEVQNKADRAALNDYRKKTDKIGTGDFAPDVANVIQRSKEFIQDFNSAIDSSVMNKVEVARRKLAEDEIGIKYLLLDKNVQYSLTNPPIGDNQGMPYRRQVVGLAKKNEAGHLKHDTYHIIDVINWVVRAMIGIQYDQNLINLDDQRAIIRHANSKNPNDNDHRMFGLNKAYYGVPESGFTVVESVSFLLEKLKEANRKISALESKNNELSTKIAGINNKITELEEKLEKKVDKTP
jgi:hypothetical protein